MMWVCSKIWVCLKMGHIQKRGKMMKMLIFGYPIFRQPHIDDRFPRWHYPASCS